MAWTPLEIAILREAYESATSHEVLNIEALCERLSRTHASVCLKASRMGFSRPGLKVKERRKDERKFSSVEDLRAAQSAQQKKWLSENEHPRGMAGKRHSDTTKEVLRMTSKQYRSSLSKEQAFAISTKALRTKVDRYGRAGPQGSRGNWKAGWREIGGKRNYYRSRWEANYARYLEWLKAQCQIRDWQHEPETFWFDKIKRGVRSYLPDFRVWLLDDSKELHEVKGWMDARSKTTLSRMAKYHPHETLLVIQEKQYKQIGRTVGPLIEGWE